MVGASDAVLDVADRRVDPFEGSYREPARRPGRGGRQAVLGSPVSASTIDALAAFEAEGEDIENEPDEPSINSDLGPGMCDVELDTADDEYDYRNNEPV